MEMHRTAAGAAINLIFPSGQGHSLIASILRETTHPGAATITRNLKQLKSTVRLSKSTHTAGNQPILQMIIAVVQRRMMMALLMSGT